MHDLAAFSVVDNVWHPVQGQRGADIATLEWSSVVAYVGPHDVMLSIL